MQLPIRPERPGDEPAIRALVTAAFAHLPFAEGRVCRIIDCLREDGDMAFSLVAENLDAAIIGHITASPVEITDGSQGWYGLGPISVIPLRQKVGIGAALIKRGIKELRDLGASGCVLFGDPDYYAAFGFVHDPMLVCAVPLPGHCLSLSFDGSMPSGVVSCAHAFE